MSDPVAQELVTAARHPPLVLYWWYMTSISWVRYLTGPVSHGPSISRFQYLTDSVSHGLSISASISPQYLMTLQYLTPVSHASSISTFLHNISTFFKFRSISKSQDLNFSGQDLTQNGDLQYRPAGFKDKRGC